MPIHQPNGARAWSMVALLFLFSFINYFDKLVMSLAGVPIMKEFGLSPSAYGTLSSSFYVLYAVSGLLTGLFVVDRITPKWLLAMLVGLWTLAQLPIVFGSSIALFYVGRMLLGVGEGPATPSAFHALYGWFSNDKRNMPTSILLTGIGAGSLLGSPVLAHVIANYGWRTGFLLCACISFAWLLLWAVFGRNGPLLQVTEHPAEQKRVEWRRFWTDSTVVANLVAATASYWMTGLAITWLAPYLQLGLNYSPAETGWLVSIILGLQVVVTLGVSWFSHRLLRRGVRSRFSRGAVMGGCIFIAGVALALAPLLESHVLKVVLLTAGFTLPQMSFVLGPAIVGEIAPPSQRGVALLVTYSVITITGLLAPIVTGRIVAAAGESAITGYTHALWLAAAILIVGGLWGLALLNPEASRARFAKATDSMSGLARPGHQPV